MALINLRNGKTIDVDLLWFLSLTDEEYQDLEAMNTGFEIDNPFHSSSMNRHSVREEEDEEEVKPVDKTEEVDIEERDDQ